MALSPLPISPLISRPLYQPATPKNSDHALKIIDSFEPTPKGDGLVPAHGTKVALAARDTGYDGPIVAQERQPSEPVEKALMLTRGQMAVPGQKPEEVLKLLDQHVQFDAMGLMMEAGVVLDKDTKDGVSGRSATFP